MRTNKLFVCKYCDKILSCMKSVKCHITMKHKVDPENPIMYHDILVSPTEVDVLLGKKTNKSSSITADKDSRGVKVSNSVLHPKLYEVTAPLASNDPDQGLAFVITGHEVAAPSMVEQQAAPRIDQGSKEFKMRQEMTKPIEVTENMDTQGGTDPSVEQDLIEPMVRQDNVTEATVRQEITVPRDGQKNEVSMVRLDVTADKISKMSGTKEKKHKNKGEKREKFSSYDYRKLANQFCLPNKQSSPPRQTDQLYDSEGEEPPSEKFPGRRQFKVPFKKKPPRGKCSNWTTCVNCSRELDCLECKYCLHPNLK